MSNSNKRSPLLVAEKHKKPKPKTSLLTRLGRLVFSRKPKKKKSRGPRKRKSQLPLILRWPLAILILIWRIIWGVTWRASVVVALLVGLGVSYYYLTLPVVTDLLDARARGSVTLLDRNDQVFAWRGEQFGGAITTDTVSPHLKNALIATEDKRFYRHIGVSPRGVASAVRINLSEGRGPLSGHGGSTLTQQTAKLLCLGIPYDTDVWASEAAYEADCRESSLWRKVKEAAYAMALEAAYTKDDILTIYMNRAFLGSGSRGFQAASERYFGKSANELNPPESAMLAGLLKAPTRYAPTNNLRRSQDRAATVLRLMWEQGYLTDQELAIANAAPATLSKVAEARAGGFFADWVMGQGPAFLASDTTEDVIMRTTFDPEIQIAAEEAVAWIFENKVSEGSKAETAVIVMSADGAVRAIVGGRNKVVGGFNRATQARRQTGSAFKPFVYATAMDLGYTPNSLIIDEPLTLDIPGSGPWTPRNYDNEFRGEITLTEALRNSLNIPAVKISESVGRENVRKIAADFGIQSDLAAGPALALGASDATLLETTGAYAGILNGGRSVRPYGLVDLTLVGDDAPLIGQDGGMGERVISETAAGYLTYMMAQVVDGGTGGRARLDGHPAAGKTGTTQGAKDAWFVGFTADYVAGVWMGNDDNVPLRGVTGGGLPAEIWHETMKRVTAGLPPRPLPIVVPAPIVPDPEPNQRGNNGVSNTENAILNILGRILGGN